LANCPDRSIRRDWVRRILDHDGYGDDPGGIEAWVRLGEAVGLRPQEMWSLEHVVPGVRFAVDAYVNFARRAPWQEAVCASLTELFAPQIHRDRLASWPVHYDWIDPRGLEYFRSRIPLAARDVQQGLDVTLAYFTTHAAQQRALDILQMKLDILWSMLDAIQQRYAGAGGTDE
jgi:pyrroloquinoline-quinone synthase